MWYKYEAFISYCHQPYDREIAGIVHRLLESYVIPKLYRKDNNRHFEKIFRDEEELGASSDLSESLLSALKYSNSLIVICSKNLPKSVWCRKEIQEFKRFHENARIFAVLIDGEPEEAFPEEFGIDFEPLAIDIRAGSSKEGIQKLKKREIYRLIAALLDIDFDDIWQRARRRRHKQIAAAAVLCLSVLGIVGGIMAYSRMRIARQEKAAELQDKLQTAKNDITLGYRPEALTKLQEVLKDYPNEEENAEQIAESAEELLIKASYVSVGDVIHRDDNIDDSWRSSEEKYWISSDISMRYSDHGKYIVKYFSDENRLCFMKTDFYDENSIILSPINETLIDFVMQDEKNRVILLYGEHYEIFDLEQQMVVAGAVYGDGLYIYGPLSDSDIKGSTEERIFLTVASGNPFSELKLCTYHAVIDLDSGSVELLEQVSPVTDFSAPDHIQVYSVEDEGTAYIMIFDNVQDQSYLISCDLEAAFNIGDVIVSEDGNEVIIIAERGIYESHLYVYYLDCGTEMPYYERNQYASIEVERIFSDGRILVLEQFADDISSEEISEQILHLINPSTRSAVELLQSDHIEIQDVNENQGRLLVLADWDNTHSLEISLGIQCMGHLQQVPPDDWKEKRTVYTTEYTVGEDMILAEVETDGISVKDLSTNKSCFYKTADNMKNIRIVLDAEKDRLGIFFTDTEMYDESGYNWNLIIWDYKLEEECQRFSWRQKGRMSDVWMSEDREYFIMIMEDSSLYRMHIDTGECILMGKINDSINFADIRTRVLFDAQKNTLYYVAFSIEGPTFCMRYASDWNVYSCETLNSLRNGEELIPFSRKWTNEFDPDHMSGNLEFSIVPGYGLVISWKDTDEVIGCIQMKSQEELEGAIYK